MGVFGLFKKGGKDKSLPIDIPEPPPFPGIGDDDSSQELPSFPEEAPPLEYKKQIVNIPPPPTAPVFSKQQAITPKAAPWDIGGKISAPKGAPTQDFSVPNKSITTQRNSQDQEVLHDLEKEFRESEPKSTTQKNYVFVKGEEYRLVAKQINDTKKILKDSVDMLEKAETVKTEEDKVLGSWRQNLEDIQRKLIFIDKVLFD